MTIKTFAPSFFKNFSLSLNRKKMCGNKSHEKETKHIHASADNLLQIRIGSLDWCKCWDGRNEAREIDCFCFREVDVMLIASGKIPEREDSISRSSFYGQLLYY